MGAGIPAVMRLVTEVIGIHALFGAFLAGVVMPREGELRHWLKFTNRELQFGLSGAAVFRIHRAQDSDRPA